MDPRVSKKTQDTLGKIIKRPPLTDKLLAKPPFRFLHDIITSVINTTGFMHGLYSTEEQNSDNVKDKESKVSFLQKALDIVSLVAGRQLSMKPSKVVAGHEPEKTNEFLQVLAEAINKQVDNDSYVQRVLRSRETNKSHEPNKEKDKTRDKSSSRRSEKERTREKGERKESSRSQPERHKERDANENKAEERDRHKGKEEERERRRSKTDEKSKDRERHSRGRNEEKEEKEREQEKERVKEREKEREKDKGRSEEKSKEKRSSERDRSSKKTRKDDTKENEKPPIEKKESDEKIEEPVPRRLQRPTSAKGSRQKREESGASPAPPPQTHDESPKQPVEEPASQPIKQVHMARPSSARPAPPKQRKSDVIPTDPLIQLGTGRPTNVITDGAQESDEDEQFIVEDNTPLQTKSSLTKEPDAEDETEHGGLVTKILETKKELEGAHQTERSANVETSNINNAAYQKQRHLVLQKIEKLQESIQTLTKSANPLGKIMDYIQEDLDSMQKELHKWKQESLQHTMALKHEKEITERTVEPLKSQLKSLEQTINDQMDVIATVKANIIRNDKRIVSMLHSVAKV